MHLYLVMVEFRIQRINRAYFRSHREEVMSQKMLVLSIGIIGPFTETTLRWQILKESIFFRTLKSNPKFTATRELLNEEKGS